MKKQIFFLITMCIMLASCNSPKKTVMEQTAVFENKFNHTFVYENDNDQVVHNVYLTITHNNHVDVKQLVLTFAHGSGDKKSFAVPIGIPLFDQQGHFVAMQTDSVWKYEIPILTDTYFSKDKQNFTFTTDEGRIINGIETVGIRIEK